MPASLQSQYYQIPYYAAGDTANYLTSYNDMVRVIDSALHDIAVAGNANSSEIETIKESLVNFGTTLQGVQEELSGLEIEPLAVAYSSNIAHTGLDAPTFYKWKNILLGTSLAAIAKDVESMPVLINVQGSTAQLMPMYVLSGNPFNIQSFDGTTQTIYYCGVSSITAVLTDNTTSYVDVHLMMHRSGDTTFISTFATLTSYKTIIRVNLTLLTEPTMYH